MKLPSLLGIAILSLTVAAHAVPPPGWTDNYAKAVEKAKAENKKLLLDFTGSDWCGYCMALDKEVFSTQKFKTWARENVILVQVDFPHHALPQNIHEQNKDLKGKYPIGGYPTIYLIDADGNVLTKQVGYSPGSGPESFIAAMDGALKK